MCIRLSCSGQASRLLRPCHRCVNGYCSRGPLSMYRFRLERAQRDCSFTTCSWLLILYFCSNKGKTFDKIPMIWLVSKFLLYQLCSSSFIGFLNDYIISGINNSYRILFDIFLGIRPKLFISFKRYLHQTRWSYIAHLPSTSPKRSSPQSPLNSLPIIEPLVIVVDT